MINARQPQARIRAMWGKGTIVLGRFGLLLFGVFILSCGTSVQMPSGLRARASASDKILLTWRDNSDNETGFWIHREEGDHPGVLDSARAGANDTLFEWDKLTPGAKYSFQICAMNDRGVSLYSGWANATTPLPLKCGVLTSGAGSTMKVQLSVWAVGGLPPYEYRWSFGDGTPTTAGPQDTIHSYSSTGMYTAHVIVTDSLHQRCEEDTSINVAQVSNVRQVPDTSSHRKRILPPPPAPPPPHRATSSEDFSVAQDWNARGQSKYDIPHEWGNYWAVVHLTPDLGGGSGKPAIFGWHSTDPNPLAERIVTPPVGYDSCLWLMPLSKDVPQVMTGKFDLISPGLYLNVLAAGVPCPGCDWELSVRATDAQDHIYQIGNATTVDGSMWRTYTFSLDRVRGSNVRINIIIANGGTQSWRYEHAFIRDVWFTVQN